MPKAIIQLGSQGDDVKRVQRYFIRNKEMDPTHLDGDFGPETDGFVRQFQQDNGLVVDGVVGPQTWGALGPYLEASPTLSYDAGDPGPADGWFGPQTTTAVQAFQRGGSGVVDEQTWFMGVGAMGLTLERAAGMLSFDPFA